MGTQETIFGVNFIDGRIKGYPVMKRGVPNRMYFRLVRGNAKYGINRFVDNKDGTISDLATGLMWQKADDGKCYTWDEALTYAQRLNLAGHKDWRLPNAKELQSIVDYSRCPETTKSPAISPLFKVSSMTMSNGVRDYPYFWTSTTHLDGPRPGNRAATICFGRAWGLHPRTRELTDVHGAGAQRGDIKTDTGHPMPQYQGPQSDLQSCRNAVRCVRTISPKKK